MQAQPGRRAVIERWGGPPLEARVRLVEPAAFTKVSALGIEEQRVKVVVEVEQPPASWQAMGDGYRVTLRVITQSVEAARSARSRTVKVGGQGRTWAKSRPCSMATTHAGNVVQRSGSSANRHAQTRRLVSPSDSPCIPYRHSDSPIAEAE